MKILSEDSYFKSDNNLVITNRFYMIFLKGENEDISTLMSGKEIEKPDLKYDIDKIISPENKVIDINKEMNIILKNIEDSDFINFKGNNNEIHIGKNNSVCKKVISLFSLPTSIECKKFDVYVSRDVIKRFVGFFNKKIFEIYYLEPIFCIKSGEDKMYFGIAKIDDNYFKERTKNKVIEKIKEEDPYSDIDFLLKKIRKEDKKQRRNN